jgi:hypothetical protein
VREALLVHVPDRIACHAGNLDQRTFRCIIRRKPPMSLCIGTPLCPYAIAYQCAHPWRSRCAKPCLCMYLPRDRERQHNLGESVHKIFRDPANSVYHVEHGVLGCVGEGGERARERGERQQVRSPLNSTRRPPGLSQKACACTKQSSTGVRYPPVNCVVETRAGSPNLPRMSIVAKTKCAELRSDLRRKSQHAFYAS